MTDPPAPIGAWRTASVVEIDHPSPHAVRLRLDVPDRINHLPGQHYVIRLTAEDGYVAQRSYSVSSAPSDPLLEFYIERLDDGEVSSFLSDVVAIEDQLQIRGPIGGWFVWRGNTELVGIAGGSGVVPFVSMLRHARDLGTTSLLHLTVSARTMADLPYADELDAAGAVIALTRAERPGRPQGRLTDAELAAHPADLPHLLCGSPAFTAAVADRLMANGVGSDVIRVESFGPSG